MTPTQEEWCPVVGYEGYYEVSSHGRVRSLDRHVPWRNVTQFNRGREMATHPAKNSGHPQVSLSRGCKPRTLRVHVLVAEAFLGPRPAGLEIRHLDGNPANVRAENLAYGTRSENNLDRVRHGVDPQASQTECIHGHPFTEANTKVDSRGWRSCRTCRRDWDRQRRSRKPSV